jgi:hypothetical protein
MARAVTFEKMPAQCIMLSGASVVYEPSVFGGDGTEARKNIVFAIEDASETAQITVMENALTNSKLLVSALKDGTLKAKICLGSVRVYNANRDQIAPPDTWRDSVVNASITVKGIWCSRTQTGLSMEVTDIQLMDKIPQRPCPF